MLEEGIVTLFGAVVSTGLVTSCWGLGGEGRLGGGRVLGGMGGGWCVGV